jgi:MFS family permease
MIYAQRENSMDDAATPRRRRLPAAVIWLGLVSLLNDVGTEMVYPLLPLFLTEVLHARRLFVGSVEGLAEATASLLKLVSGRITDQMSRRKPLTVIGYAISALGRPVLSIASRPLHVLLLRVGDRVGKGVRTSPRDALLADAAPVEERGRAYGFHQAMDNAGAIAGPVIATLLLAAGVGLRRLFLLTLIPGVLTVAALIFGVREQARAAQAPKAAWAPVDPATRRSIGTYLIAVALFGLGNSSDAFLLLRAEQCGLGLRWVPLLWMAHNATKALLSTWGGALSDQRDRRHIILVGWAVYALTYLGFGLASRPWHAWALFVVYGLYYALTDGATKALVADLAPAAARGRAFGWYHATVGLVALPASLGFGALADRHGALLPFCLSAALAASAALWLGLAVRPPPRPQTAGG